MPDRVSCPDPAPSCCPSTVRPTPMPQRGLRRSTSSTSDGFAPPPATGLDHDLLDVAMHAPCEESNRGVPCLAMLRSLSTRHYLLHRKAPVEPRGSTPFPCASTRSPATDRALLFVDALSPEYTTNRDQTPARDYASQPTLRLRPSNFPTAVHWKSPAPSPKRSPRQRELRRQF